MARTRDININDEGLTELNPSLITTDALVDIVFVHGLRGHPHKTWTYKGSKKDLTLPHSSNERAAEVSPNVDRTADSLSQTVHAEESHTTTEVRAHSTGPIISTNADGSETQSHTSDQAENIDAAPVTDQAPERQPERHNSGQRSIMWRLNIFKRSSKTTDKKKDQTQASKANAGVETSDVVAEQKPGSNAEHTFFWPQNLPESCKRARVMTYGYDADVTKFFGGAANQDTFYDHANSLLGALDRKRRDASLRDRPIIFVVHSLGGLVVKQMLIRADQSDAFPVRQKVCSSTKALFFLGTPHRGSNYTGWGRIVTGLARIIFDTNPGLVKNLKPDNEALMQLEETFNFLLHRHKFDIFTFSEGKGFQPYPFLKNKIVEYNKVGDPGRERFFTINANHSNMCKFWGINDPGYEITAGELDGAVQEIILQVETEIREKETLEALIDNKKHEEILDLLDYENREFREKDITDAFVDTFQWMLPAQSLAEDYRGTHLQQEAMHRFIHWITCSDGSLFWICGKAGSGKSTLMKRLAKNSNLEQLLRSRLAGQEYFVATFWFSENVQIALLKSREGMLRSLLYQLLSQQPNSTPAVFPDLWARALSKASYKWLCLDLQDALTKFCELNKRSRIVFLVDGLDEYDFYEYADYYESDGLSSRKADVDRAERKSRAHSEIGDFFKNLAKIPNTRVCIASRPKKFDSIFYGQPNICLEDLTFTDIKTYVEGRFEVELPQISSLSEDDTKLRELQEEIVKRAGGVFLWVKLIVEILIDGSREFDTVEELRKKLDTLPIELGGPDGLYMRMLHDIKMEHRGQAAFFFDIVQKATKPLDLLTMHFAEEDLSNIINRPLKRFPQNEAQQKYLSMKGRLRNRCAGLLECVQAHGGSSSHIDSSQTGHFTNADPSEMAFYKCLFKGVDPLVTNLEHTIQFIHLTFLEFLRRPYSQNFLREMRSSTAQKLDVNLAIAKGTLASLKFLSTSYDRMWDQVHIVLHFAQCAERESAEGSVIEMLLDELDRVMTWNFDLDFEGDYPKFCYLLMLSRHWYMAEPQEQGGRDLAEVSDIACVAVLADLYSYVQRRLHLREISNLKTGRRSLLEYAVCPPINNAMFEFSNEFDGIGLLQASPQMVELLLNDGADPNEIREKRKSYSSSPGGCTLWQHLLTTGYLQYKQDGLSISYHHKDHMSRFTSRQHKERWSDIALMFLNYGADATCSMAGEWEKQGGPLHSTLFYIHQRLCPERDLITKLHDLLKKAGAVWLADEDKNCADCLVSSSS